MSAEDDISSVARSQGWDVEHEFDPTLDPDPEIAADAQRQLREWQERAFDQAWANARVVTSDDQKHHYLLDPEPFVAEMRAEMLTTKAG